VIDQSRRTLVRGSPFANYALRDSAVTLLPTQRE
jgi:hypothetical protein